MIFEVQIRRPLHSARSVINYFSAVVRFELYILCILVLYFNVALPNVTYPEGAVRLLGGSGPHEGRVEVTHNGEWGTVCDDGWDILDATVVCHELGYIRAADAPQNAFFGGGSGPIWYDEVGCTGTELNLTECSSDGRGLHNCQHSEDAGVVCTSKLYLFLCILWIVLCLIYVCMCQ